MVNWPGSIVQEHMRLTLIGTVQQLLDLAEQIEFTIRPLRHVAAPHHPPQLSDRWQDPGQARTSVSFPIAGEEDPRHLSATITVAPVLCTVSDEIPLSIPNCFSLRYTESANAGLQPYATLVYKDRAIRINLDGMGSMLQHLALNRSREKNEQDFSEALAAMEDDMRTDYVNGRDDKYPYMFKSTKDLQEQDPS